jgi:hypothetical protein
VSQEPKFQQKAAKGSKNQSFNNSDHIVLKKMASDAAATTGGHDTNLLHEIHILLNNLTLLFHI